MGALIRFVVPGRPAPLERNKHRIVTPRDGKQFVQSYLPSKSRAEQGAVRIIAMLAMQGKPPMEGPIELRMAQYYLIPKSWSRKKHEQAIYGDILPTIRPDASNVLKNIEDGCKGVVWGDDAQIAALHVWRFYSDQPRVVVEVGPAQARKPPGPWDVAARMVEG